MEKYGVVLDEEKTKTAHDTTTCPLCGRVVAHTNEVGLPYCVQCGTEPFEARRTDNSDKQEH